MYRFVRSAFAKTAKSLPRKTIFLFAAIIPISGFGALDSPEVKAALDRMKSRQAEIDGILKQNQAGERNDALLEPMSDPPPAVAKLIEEENQDRGVVYAELAIASASSLENVKLRRAESLRERLIPGVFRMVPGPEDNKWEWSKGEKAERIPPRLLTRPGASLYGAPDGNVTKSGLENFTMFEVLEQQKGSDENLWYRVAEKGGQPIGWLKEAESLEWHQALVMQYTPQRDRQRVLYFEDKEELRRLANLTEAERAREVPRLVELAETGKDPGRSIIATEPVFDQMTQEIPVVIPILEHEKFSFDGVRESNLLRVAAATRSDPASQSVAMPKEKPPLDIVFVVDTTSSMKPYLDETKKAVNEFAQSVDRSDPTARFGVVAYRDSDPSFRDKMEYSVKNFTPSLVDAVELVSVLSTVNALPSDPGDPIPEDVFSGIHSAIDSAWRTTPGEGIRVVVHVGDASGNDPYTNAGVRNLGNESGLDAASVRELLNQARILVRSIHIRYDKYKSDHAKAEGDFSILARNPGAVSSITSANYDQESSFGSDIREALHVMRSFVTDEIDKFLADAKRAQSEGSNSAMDAMLAGLLANAYAEWVVGQNRVPLDRDFKGWVIPDDLVDPSRKSMEVRLMLRRHELENLKRKLDEILEATRESANSGGDFFDRIQSLSGTTIGNPSASPSQESLEIPDFIKDLPYKSTILGIQRGQWETMSEQEKTRNINNWRNMSGYYGTLLQDLRVWKKLSPEGDDFVMVPLSSLP